MVIKMSNTDAIIKNIIAEILEVSVDDINDDLAIGDIVEWDSIHHLQIISAIEKEFGFSFTPDVMLELETVSDIVYATEARVNK